MSCETVTPADSTAAVRVASRGEMIEQWVSPCPFAMLAQLAPASVYLGSLESAHSAGASSEQYPERLQRPYQLQPVQQLYESGWPSGQCRELYRLFRTLP